MTKTGAIYVYSTLIKERSGHVKVQKNRWSNLGKACNTKGILEPPVNGSADSFYLKKDNSRPISLKVEFPFFKFKEECIPRNAYITGVEFQVTLKTNGNFDVPYPMGVFTLYGAPSSLTTNYNNAHWRWKEGMYHYLPAGKIQSSWDTVYYRMSEEIFQKYYNTNGIYDSRFGLILYFLEANKFSKKEHQVSIKNVRVSVSYELPDYKIIFNNNNVNTPVNPLIVECGEEYVLNVDCINDSKAKDTPQEINVLLPSNTEVVRYTGNYNPENNTWTVNGNSREHNRLMLVLKTWNSGEQVITFNKNDIVKADYYIAASSNLDDRYSVKCSAPIMRKGFKSTIDFKAIARSNDGKFIIPADIRLDNGEWSDYKGEWELITDTDDITIDPDTTRHNPNSTDKNICIGFNIPTDTTVNLDFKYHIVPQRTGQHKCIVQNYQLPFNVLEPYKYIITNNPSYNENECYLFIHPSQSISQRNNVITTSDLKIPIISVSCPNNTLKIKESNVTVDYHKPVSYIGAIELFKFKNIDPKSTLSNNLVEQNSLTKKYMGKEMDIDEDITLKLLIHPKDSVTLQGYTKLDAPTPINIDPACFEGDPLNHRGWVEISKVSLSQRSKLYYEADVDVKYLTHDINSSFEIVKGDKPNTLGLPELLDVVCSMGDNLSESNVFTVDTDGAFMFDDNEGESDDNNIFVLSNGQSFNIRSVLLGDVFEVDFSWMSESRMGSAGNLVDVSRIIRLVDNVTGNPVMEYEYFNITWDSREQNFKCDSILRVWNEDGEIVPVNTHDITLLSTVVDDVPESFGSAFQVKVNQNRLSVSDEGVSGNEFEMEDILLTKGEYYIEFDFKNNNDSHVEVDVGHFVNLECSRNVDDVLYKDYLDNLVVSPFPVPYKDVVFVRDSEDGSLYYYHDDGNPFRFKIEPFYQFKTGCCLLSVDGVYLFDLNNSYARFYMSNGLVRLGFNKSNGRLYLDKFDVFSRVWFSVGCLRLVGDVRFELVVLSADKCVVRAGDLVFSIWRGHPFIMVEHPESSILFEDNFKYIYADKINGIIEQTPSIFNLLNTENLLPKDIGGKKLNTKNITTTETNTDTEGITITPILTENITIQSENTQDIIEWTPTTISINNMDLNNGTIYYIIDGQIITEKPTTTCTLPIPNTEEDNKYFFTTTGKHTVQIIYINNYNSLDYLDGEATINVKDSQGNPIPDAVVDLIDTSPNTDIAISEIKEVTVNQQPVTEPIEEETDINGDYKLTPYNFPKKVKYCDQTPLQFRLTRGGYDITSKEELTPVEVILPDGTTQSLKVTNGIVTTHNRLKGNIGKLPQKCTITAQYTIKPTTDTVKTVTKTTATLTMEKATPYFQEITEGVKGKYRLIGNGEKGETGISNAKIIYKVAGIANKKTITTNTNGEFNVNMSNAMSIKLQYAGNEIYTSCKRTFNYPN